MRVTYRGLKLSPCPFDGKKAHFYKGEHDEDDIKVICSGCGAEGPLFDDSYDPKGIDNARANAEVAAEHWNKRTEDKKPGAKVKTPRMMSKETLASLHNRIMQ